MTFLPDDYEDPKTTSDFYMKFQEGENKFRILSSPILGWEDWKDKKPLRFTKENKPEKSIDPKRPMSFFWAFIVYNYSEKKIQILHIKQVGVQKRIKELCKDTDWGSPYEYDIKIFRKGTGIETQYKIQPVPHKKLDEGIIQDFYNNPCNLEALFAGENPFAEGQKSYTSLFNNKPAKVEKVSFSEQQALSQDVQ